MHNLRWTAGFIAAVAALLAGSIAAGSVLSDQFAPHPPASNQVIQAAPEYAARR
ncbi:hypothetical protein [Pengzhenrongella phosphoraccumulans]|uniref:hypothetical protein n=1 Tax=Pengzhenrongella phosphoraccumulans TaxID=3114394 RepID=UPI00388D9B24